MSSQRSTGSGFTSESKLCALLLDERAGVKLLPVDEFEEGDEELELELRCEELVDDLDRFAEGGSEPRLLSEGERDRFEFRLLFPVRFTSGPSLPALFTMAFPRALANEKRCEMRSRAYWRKLSQDMLCARSRDLAKQRKIRFKVEK